MKLFRTRLNKLISWVLILALINIQYSCYYYKYSEATASIEKLEELKNSPNYLIVHQEEQAFHLRDVRINQEAQIITGVLQALPPDHLKYKDTRPLPKKNRYIKQSASGARFATPDVINEVHLYVHDVVLEIDASIIIPLAVIDKIEVYDHDTSTTTASFVFGGMGVVLGMLVIIGIIVLLTKSSCPFIYVNNGEEYMFAGEIYSGAIFKSLERDDYLLLPKTSTDSMEVLVANKLKEVQYINQLELIEVRHPIGTSVLPDQEGKMHLLQAHDKLICATVNGDTITNLLQQKDSNDFTFNAEYQENYFNDVILSFPNDLKAEEGHLVLRAKNSLFGDYVFGEFTKLFGTSYSAWIEKQNQRTAPEMKNWKEDQGLAMNVFLETPTGWELINTLDLVGPLAYRDFVVPIDFTAQQGDEVRLKLSAGFMFWDLDYVGMGYASDEGINIQTIQAASAESNDGECVLPLIAGADREYLVQKNIGDETRVVFHTSPTQPGYEYDYILHARGYYNHVREYTNTPSHMALLTFKKPGRFSQFSKEKIDEVNSILAVAELSASTK